MRAEPSTAGIVLVAVGATGLLAAPALAGPDWVEIGDAGSSVLTAQAPLRPPGAPQLTSISGTLGGPGIDEEDLYVVRITDPVMFSMTTGSADFNPVLWLFHVTVTNDALGLLANDDQAAGNPLPRLVGAATDGTGVVVSSPGDYIVGITGRGRVPVSATGEIFNLAGLTEISGADGVGGLNVLSGWTGEGETGTYHLNFEFIDFPVFPAPGSVVLLALAGAATGRRRRPAKG